MAFNKFLNRIKGNRSWRALSAVGIILLAGALIEGMSLLQYNYTHRLMEKELAPITSNHHYLSKN